MASLTHISPAGRLSATAAGRDGPESPHDYRAHAYRAAAAWSAQAVPRVTATVAQRSEALLVSFDRRTQPKAAHTGGLTPGSPARRISASATGGVQPQTPASGHAGAVSDTSAPVRSPSCPCWHSPATAGATLQPGSFSSAPASAERPQPGRADFLVSSLPPRLTRNSRSRGLHLPARAPSRPG